MCPATSSSDVTAHGLVMTAPNFWAWIEACDVRSWPAMPSREPEVVLDPRAGGGLATHRHGVDGQRA